MLWLAQWENFHNFAYSPVTLLSYGDTAQSGSLQILLHRRDAHGQYRVYNESPRPGSLGNHHCVLAYTVYSGLKDKYRSSDMFRVFPILYIILEIAFLPCARCLNSEIEKYLVHSVVDEAASGY